MAAIAAVLTVAAMACSPGPTPAVDSTTAIGPGVSTVATPTDVSSPLPERTPEPLPSGTLALPAGFAVELEPGTYWSSPPFDIGFAFEVAEVGWVAGHLNSEFFDIQQFDGEPAEGIAPERIVGFAHPLAIYEPAVVEVAGLTPEEAVALWVARTDIEASNVTELSLLGGDAIRVDVHSPTSMVPLFGGDEGIFRLDSAYDVRIVAIAVDGGLFLASVHASPSELEAAWEQAVPILESISL